MANYSQTSTNSHLSTMATASEMRPYPQNNLSAIAAISRTQEYMGTEFNHSISSTSFDADSSH